MEEEQKAEQASKPAKKEEPVVNKVQAFKLSIKNYMDAFQIMSGQS